MPGPAVPPGHLHELHTVRLLAANTHESVTEIETTSFVAGNVAKDVHLLPSVFHSFPGPQLANSSPRPATTRWNARLHSEGKVPFAVNVPESNMKLRPSWQASSPLSLVAQNQPASSHFAGGLCDGPESARSSRRLFSAVGGVCQVWPSARTSARVGPKPIVRGPSKSMECSMATTSISFRCTRHYTRRKRH